MTHTERLMDGPPSKGEFFLPDGFRTETLNFFPAFKLKPKPWFFSSLKPASLGTRTAWLILLDHQLVDSPYCLGIYPPPQFHEPIPYKKYIYIFLLLVLYLFTEEIAYNTSQKSHKFNFFLSMYKYLVWVIHLLICHYSHPYILIPHYLINIAVILEHW